MMISFSATTPSSLHDPPPAPSKHQTRCLRNRVQASKINTPASADTGAAEGTASEGLHACTDRKAENGAHTCFDQENGPHVVSLRSSPGDDMPRFLQRCVQC